jgi:glucokinase
MSGQYYIIGFDLGGTNMHFGLLSVSGELIAAGSSETLAEQGPEAAMDRAAAAIRALVKEAGIDASALLGVGLGSPGPLDLRAGKILETPNLKGWSGFALSGELGRRLGCPVYLDNDANAAALGEYWLGAGRGCTCLIYFTLGTGIGGGIVLEGRVWRGPDGTGGELGHMTIFPDGLECGCGNFGCLEAHANAAAIERFARQAAAHYPDSRLAARQEAGERLTPKVVNECAQAGDGPAIGVLEQVGRALGIASASYTNIFNPDKIVFSGGITAAAKFILPVVEREIRLRVFPVMANRVKVQVSELGPNAGVIGAAAVLLELTGRLGKPEASRV